ncbi:ADP-ribosylation factor-like protein 2 [Gossypium arboreum]|uniref:ADP-ribosylation factor-like protein 2 n=1 Tax=Gossypium arboreum TaxID=29729 RepID=UPI0022F18C64|nr:ADP-ribosylation factor-like protein 2 [Gossypium arboreum]
MDKGVSSREYALVKEALWLRTLKWHNDSKTSEENERYYCVAEGQSQEVFPLQIRLSFSPGTNLLYTLNIWDVGGQRTIRSYWRNYFEQTDGLVWVVDSSDLRRLDDCKMELDNLLKEERLSGASLLILANKQDIKGALTQAEIAKILKVRQRIQSLQAGKAKA